MNVKLAYFVAIALFCYTSTSSPHSARNKRTLFSWIHRIRNFSKCGLRPCPPWRCQDDSAVIHGYCCGCPRSEFDNVPVPCYPDLKCPVSPQHLCSDYNFMMECCCTGA